MGCFNNGCLDAGFHSILEKGDVFSKFILDLLMLSWDVMFILGCNVLLYVMFILDLLTMLGTSI